MRSDRERLLDIREAIEAIERYSAKGREAFLGDELIQTWIVHHIQVIGEAASKLSQAFRERRGDVVWADVISMRNVLVHHYFGIDLDEVWNTVISDFPSLKAKIDSAIADLHEEPPSFD